MVDRSRESLYLFDERRDNTKMIPSVTVLSLKRIGRVEKRKEGSPTMASGLELCAQQLRKRLRSVQPLSQAWPRYR